MVSQSKVFTYEKLEIKAKKCSNFALRNSSENSKFSVPESFESSLMVQNAYKNEGSKRFILKISCCKPLFGQHEMIKNVYIWQKC